MSLQPRSLQPWSRQIWRGVAVAAVLLAAAGCGRKEEKGVDATTKDGGLADQPGPSDTTPKASPTTLPGDVTVQATPVEAQVEQYLKSGAPAERRFTLDFVRFDTGGQLRQDPNVGFTSLAAILNAYPNASVQAHAYAAAGENQKAATDRAAQVAQALIRNGVDATRVTSSGSVAAHAGEDRVELIVKPAGLAAAPAAKP